MAYDRRARGKRKGGPGAVIMPIFIVAILGGLAWFGWTQLQKANRKPKAPTGPKFTLRAWAGSYGLGGDIPDKLPDPWRFAFKVGPYYEEPGKAGRNPTAWVDLQLEDGRFTGVLFAVYRGADIGTAPFGLLEEKDFAGREEGGQLRGFILDLSRMGDGKHIERMTSNFLFFGWKKKSETALRRSLVCVVRSTEAPQARRMYEKAKADWAAGVAGGTAAPAGPRTKFDVVLMEVGKGHRSTVVAAICRITGVSPEVAGVAVDGAPKPVRQNVSREEAERIRKELEAAGAKVKIK